MSEKSFTGRARRRTTTRRVKVADKVSRALITGGGIGTILAVGAICVFLVWVVVPLFQSAEVEAAARHAREPDEAASRRLVTLQADEYRTMVWLYFDDGTFENRQLGTWELLRTERPFGDTPPRAWAFDFVDPRAVFAFDDGAIRVARVGFVTRFLSDDDPPPELEGLEIGQTAPWERGVVERTPKEQLRLLEFEVELEEAMKLPTSSPATGIDLSVTDRGQIVAVLDESGALGVHRVRRKTNRMTGRVTVQLRSRDVPYDAEGRGVPDRVHLGTLGDVVFLVWEDGTLRRFGLDQATGDWREVETVDLTPDPGVTVLRTQYLIGKRSLAVADSAGGLRVWFRAREEAPFPDRDFNGVPDPSPDGFRFVPAHTLLESASPVTSLAASPGSHLLLSGHEDGVVRVFYATNHHLVAEIATEDGAPAHVLTTPREDMILAVGDTWVREWAFDKRYPEVTLRSLFAKQWYEGSPGPAHVWQSTGATNEFEPKLSMVPLVFGTLKATLYSLLFGVPIALLAAVFTSEFLSPRAKVPIKSTIEVMASLPSVVLGFAAALVIAPFAQDRVAAVLLSFLTIPGAFLLGAYAWQTLPQAVAIRLQGWPRLAGMVLMLLLGVGAATWGGPWVERTFFAGDIGSWLDGQRGDATGGWLFLLLPACTLVWIVLSTLFARPFVRRLTAGWSRPKAGLADGLRWVVGAVVILFGAWGLAELLSGDVLRAGGFDVRGTVVDTYVQRNALVVGFVMGFAIIPIIYTLAEDALSSVPNHLREGSLGAGATPWQTAMRIIVPTAMSGLFSAVMIGLGRAVGETMIVLMAAGNTPILDWNVFSGFRTLSANIAVELPEAVRGDYHYRTLFLSALALFALTFLINTVAEAVRQRVRKRAFQL